MEEYPYQKRYWYPHMGPLDVAIWERFIEKYPDRFDYCIYDLPVGAGAEHPDDTPSEMSADWQYLTKYKCDVIAYKDDKPTVIEIKPRAGLGSIGQIINYADLFIEYVDRNADPSLCIITDAMRSDMDWLCEKRGIDLIIV